jgi:hypothetical protein
MTYANSTERIDLISGLRALADFLERSPEIPAPRWADVMVFPSSSIDQENRQDVDYIAVLIGAGVDDETGHGGHYTASRKFGPVEYRAIAIPKERKQ